MNYKQSELEHFAQQADSWWDVDGPMRTLHHLNPLRLSWIASQCKLAGKKVLDVGCGGGLLCEALSQQGALVTGLDLAPELIEVATLHAQQGDLNIDYQLQSVEDFSIAKVHQGGSFDVVCCMEMLEHVPNYASVVQACAALVKPNGWVFFSTINRTTLAYVGAVLLAENVMKLLPKGTHQHQQFITPAELRNASSSAGLRLHSISGVAYNPLRARAWLTRNASINYMMSLQKIA